MSCTGSSDGASASHIAPSDAVDRAAARRALSQPSGSRAPTRAGRRPGFPAQRTAKNIWGKFATGCEPRWLVARLLCEARRERGAGPHRDVGPGESGEPGLITPQRLEARRKRGAGPQTFPRAAPSRGPPSSPAGIQQPVRSRDQGGDRFALPLEHFAHGLVLQEARVDALEHHGELEETERHVIVEPGQVAAGEFGVAGGYLIA